MQHLQLADVGYTYPAQDSPLFSHLSVTAAPGWTGVVGGNGTGKSTLLRIIAGEITVDRGNLRTPQPVYHCVQRTDAAPNELVELCSYPDADAGRLVSRLEIEGDWPYRWTTLSQGERKRAQVAVALWSRPAVLLLDEPTNHLDGHSRGLLGTALQTFEGIGLLVSHDRDLLDDLCYQCLFFDIGGSAVMRPGGFSAGSEIAEKERERDERVYRQRVAEKRKIEREADRRRRVAAQQDSRNTKSRLARKDSDGRARINQVRVSGADGQAGRLSRQLDSRVAQADERLGKATRPVLRRTGFSIDGRTTQGDALLRRPQGELTLHNGVVLCHPELLVRPTDRIGVVGPNGSGKTTLIEELRSSAVAPHEILYLPQEFTRQDTIDLVSELQSLGNDAMAIVMSTFARLGSDPVGLLRSPLPSPGEARKVALALGLLRSPELIIMDEPTNHLDVVATSGLEDALAEYPGALLMVSHDTRFIRTLATSRWELTRIGEETHLSVVL